MVLRLPSSRLVVNPVSRKGPDVGLGGAQGLPQGQQDQPISSLKGRKIAPLPSSRPDLYLARFKRRTSRPYTSPSPVSCSLCPPPPLSISRKRDRVDEDEDRENLDINGIDCSAARPTKRLRLAPADAKAITLSYRVRNIHALTNEPPAAEPAPKVILGLTHRHDRELAQAVVSKVHATATVVHPLDDYELQSTLVLPAPVATRPAPPPPPSSDAKLIRQRQAQAFKTFLTTSSELKLYRTMQVNNAIRTGKAYVASVPLVRSTLSGPRTAKDKWNKLKVRIINRPPRGATTSSSLHIAKRPKPAQPSLVRYATMMNFALRDAQRVREELLQAAATGHLVQCSLDSLDDEEEDPSEEEEEDDLDCIIGDSFNWTHPDLL